MSILDSIYAFQTGTYTVTRRPTGTFVDGIYQPAAASTFTIRAVIQPAREIARVMPARDMRETEQNQFVYDVMMLHTDTEVKTRTPTTDADMITFKGDQWQVIRVEEWDYNGVLFWQAIITRTLDGAS